MPSVRANGLDIFYESFGDPADPPLLLVMGLGAQLISWEVGFVELLVARGFRVIRFDNRDVGLSSKIENGPRPDLIAAFTAGDTSSASYTLTDMADDTAGLLDALGIRAAHVAGVSMGGFIAQTLAIRHPDRVLSLCSIMSSTGDPAVGQPTPEALPLLLRRAPRSREEAAERAVESVRVFGSKGLPVDWDRVRARAAEAYDRSFHPPGYARQLLAVLASGDRTSKLRELTVPAVVIHGTDDRLVQPDGGIATAEAIPGAELVMIDGMGHDLPPAAWPQIVGAVCAAAARAEVRR